MFWKSVYVDMFVHDACNKMEISHSWCCHESPYLHATTTMFDCQMKIFFESSSPGFLHA